MGQVNYKLCTICNTYNQSLYIEETFNGFCMQETDFPFVCAIIDDKQSNRRNLYILI